MNIKIGNCNYKIEETKDKFNETFWNRKTNELKLYGQCDAVHGIITIWADLPEDRKRRTLVHELTHAFLYVYWESYTVKDMYDNEDVCCFMETFGEEILKIVNEYFLGKTADL